MINIEWIAGMDATDRIILDRLQADSTQTYAEIGAAAGLSASAVNDRLTSRDILSGSIRGDEIADQASGPEREGELPN